MGMIWRIGVDASGLQTSCCRNIDLLGTNVVLIDMFLHDRGEIIIVEFIVLIL